MTAISSVTDANVIGTVSYNSYVFPPIRNCKVKFVPKYDETGRVRIGTEFTVVVAWLITGSSQSDQSGSLDLMYAKLSEPGKDLDCRGVGLGELSVGPTAGGTFEGRKADLLWGPKPQMGEVEPLAFRAAMATWSCTFTLAMCSTADGSSGAYALEHAFETLYSIDERGLLTRTIRGHLLIATRRNGTSITASADQLREQMAQRIPVPVAFARSQQWTESADHSRLDFSIVDRQMESDDALPLGCTSADVDISASSSQIGFTTWNVTISGSVETAPGMSREWGWAILYGIATNRLGFITAGVSGGSRTVIPTQIDVSRGLFSRRTNATFVFSVVEKTAGPGLVNSVGMFDPLGNDWQAWQQSLAVNHRARGVSNMGNPMPGGDAITGPCSGGLANFRVSNDPQALGIVVGNLTQALEPKIEPEASYLRWECWLGTNYTQAITRQKNIQPFLPASLDIGSSQANISSLFATSGATISGDSATTNDVLQYSSGGSCEVWLIGRALRLKEKVVVPRLKEVTLIGGGTVPVSEADCNIRQSQVCMHGPVPVYGAMWSIRYYTQKPIKGELQQVPNPISKAS